MRCSILESLPSRKREVFVMGVYRLAHCLEIGTQPSSATNQRPTSFLSYYRDRRRNPADGRTLATVLPALNNSTKDNRLSMFSSIYN
jgi:hypothetical protein